MEDLIQVSIKDFFTVTFSGVSAFALLRLSFDLGKVAKTIESHEKRLDNIERKIF